MSQQSLFGEVEQALLMLELPALMLGPIRSRAGYISALLRDGASVKATPAGEEFVSPRIKAPAFVLPSGERIVVTNRKNARRPSAAHGLLLLKPDGSLAWISHQVVEDLNSEAVKRGWQSVIEDRANEWENKFSFRSEKRLPDGSPDPGKPGLRPPQIGALHAIGALEPQHPDGNDSYADGHR